jgi:hypothetical protein
MGSFDSESALAKHRDSPLVGNMLSWLLNEKPNGTHPLPVPVPLQIAKGSYVRSSRKEEQDPFIVITQIKATEWMLWGIEAAIAQFTAKLGDIEGVLMFMSGKAETETWVVAAYETKQIFEEKGFAKLRFENGKGIPGIWEEHLLEIEAGYLFRS